MIQKRVAYFDYTVALGGSFVTLALSGPPSVSLPASLVRPRLRHAMVDVAD